MDIKRKLQLLEQHIESIAAHRDAEAMVRIAALDRAHALLNEAELRIRAEVQAEIQASVGMPEAAQDD